jgi:probable F420-dependent oxidoreductase
MADRKFRFGVVAGQADDLDQLAAFVRRIEDLGFDVLLSPDTMNLAAPFTTLTAAATLSRTLRVGTFVLAAPLYRPAAIAWQAASIDRLTGGRFELGIGAGRPGAAGEAERLGVPWGSPGQRVDQVGESLAAVKATFADAFAAADQASDNQPPEHGFLRPAQRPHPPLMIAAGGPKALSLAAREVDIISFALGSGGGEAELADRVRLVRESAGERFDDLELSLNVFVVGDTELPPWITSRFGVDPALARDNQLLSVLNGDTDTVVDVLLRRRDEFGISYVCVNSFAMAAFAPVIERLAGR